MPYSPEDRRKFQLDKYYSRRTQFIQELGGECVQCGSTEDLQFDHIDPKTKSFGIANKMMSASMEALRKEIEKCQLLCQECHAEKTAKEQSTDIKHGTYTGYKKETRKGLDTCDACKAANAEYMRKLRNSGD